jgi:hypothetical protein
MMRRTGLLALAVSVGALILAGCGGGGDNVPIPAQPGQTFPTETRANVLSLGSTVLQSGVLTPIEVRLVNPSNVAGVQGRILYDSTVLDVVDPTTLPDAPDAFEGSILPGGGTINYETNRAAVNNMKGITFALGNATAANAAGGRLFRLWVRSKAGVPINTATALTLDPAFPFVMADPHGVEQSAVFAGGAVTVGL